MINITRAASVYGGLREHPCALFLLVIGGVIGWRVCFLTTTLTPVYPCTSTAILSILPLTGI
jgi:hypothetical protein